MCRVAFSIDQMNIAFDCGYFQHTAFFQYISKLCGKLKLIRAARFHMISFLMQYNFAHVSAIHEITSCFLFCACAELNAKIARYLHHLLHCTVYEQ